MLYNLSFCIGLNVTYPIIADRISNDYLEVGSGVLFLVTNLASAVFQNLVGYLIKNYTRESSVRAINFCGWMSLLATGFMVVGTMLSKKPFRGHSKKVEAK